MRILVVEDHIPTARSLELYLQAKHEVTWVDSCKSAVHQLEKQPLDLLLVDLGLPDGSGLELCSYPSIRGELPAIIISGKSETHTKVLALESGADDYILKPFSPVELLARIQAVTRRYQREKSHELNVGVLTLQCAERKVQYRGNVYQLTSTEEQLLRHLVRHAGQVCSKVRLCEVLSERAEDAPNILEVHVKNLRRKLGIVKKDHLIETVYGVGYRLNPAYA
jgi:DNA-binding response OmpR family regulator